MRIESLDSQKFGTTSPQAAAARKPYETNGVEKTAGGFEIDKGKINKAVEIANDIGKMFDTRFEYSIDKGTNLEIVKVVNSKSGETIRQMPPEEIVTMLNRMYEMLGWFVDTKI